MARATHGIIDVEINGKKYTMKPTLAAYEKIETRMGGLRQAIESCSNMSIDSIAFIVASGSGTGSKEMNELKENIFQEGALNVLPKVTEYLMKLLNPSGKETNDGVQEEKEAGE